MASRSTTSSRSGVASVAMLIPPAAPAGVTRCPLGGRTETGNNIRNSENRIRPLPDGRITKSHDTKAKGWCNEQATLTERMNNHRRTTTTFDAANSAVQAISDLCRPFGTAPIAGRRALLVLTLDNATWQGEEFRPDNQAIPSPDSSHHLRDKADSDRDRVSLAHRCLFGPRLLSSRATASEKVHHQ